MNAGLFSRDAQEFLQRLARHDVRYLLVGDIAVNQSRFCPPTSCVWTLLRSLAFGEQPTSAPP